MFNPLIDNFTCPTLSKCVCRCDVFTDFINGFQMGFFLTFFLVILIYMIWSNRKYWYHPKKRR
jgi:glycerol uptake facilitator-like aquaporin